MHRSRIPLVLVTGLQRQLGARVGEAFLDRPGTVVVHSDAGQLGQGVVVRTIRRRTAGPVLEDVTAVELAHGCLSCTLRLDLLPLLRELARTDEVERIVLHLDPALEPEHLCWAVQNVVLDAEPEGAPETAGDWVDVEAVLAVLEAATWLDDATGGDDLADRGLAATPDDGRTLAQVAVGQVGFADAVLLAGAPADPWSGARLSAVLDRLVPAAPRTDIRASPWELLAALGEGARRGRVSSAHDPLVTGEPPLAAACGVQLVRFSAGRPLHPQRLHESLDVLLEGVVCSHGRMWLATQHDRVVWLESAGQGLRLGDAGPWLSSLSDEEWSTADPAHRVAAALRWDPVHGDRHSEVVVLTAGQPADAVTAALAAAVLTDEEWAAGPDAWRAYPDPFGTWHADPCEASAHADHGTTPATPREEHS